MNVTYNGQPRELPADTTVAQLLALLKLEPRYVAVEVNQEVVPRRVHGETVLRDGDVIEVVTFVGGG
ncbi:MAG TPA: sulfur carrier protein ThiS [Pirellulaceae bacterium]|nr:sulfur carrier protein ThiS [Pirellulaceae bacterium]